MGDVAADGGAVADLLAGEDPRGLHQDREVLFDLGIAEEVAHRGERADLQGVAAALDAPELAERP